MSTLNNPFEYEAANNLPVSKIATYFIDDFNYSRFIDSTRNVVIVGDRGSGKTMALMYNSLVVRKHASDEVPRRVGIYVPCKTVLMKKKEQELLKDPDYASILSENFLTMSVLYHLVDDLKVIADLTNGCDAEVLKQEVAHSLGLDLPPTPVFLDALKQAIQKEAREVQLALNAPSVDADFPATRSFGTSVLPLLDTLRRIPKLKNAHFMFMLDDVHDLNDDQLRVVNSWIAYRDHSLFSIKLATARADQLHFKTPGGGSILEGHDFIQIDLEQPYHNEESNFGQLASKLISKRLKEAGIECTPEEFFPLSPTVEKELEECREIVRKRAQYLYPDGSAKKINDYVYRFARAEWFRQRANHSNLPAYSGFQTLVYLSTGVIRNLLEPCYWMYDDAQSQTGSVSRIDPQLQRDRIIDRSKRIWERLEQLDRFIEGCTRSDAKRIFNMFDQLAILFRKRLDEHESEPRAISFTISAMSEEDESDLLPLLEIARAAQLLYIRSGPAKERGRRESYYVPNRMLWPVRGLDPHGQHARVSIQAEHLRNATKGVAIPFDAKKETPVKPNGQRELFNDEA